MSKGYRSVNKIFERSKVVGNDRMARTDLRRS